MNHTRHMNIFQIPDSMSVEIIGAGGLGSPLALALAKMGFKYMTLYDHDVISEDNLATQLHRCSDVGTPKVYSLMETLRMFSDDVEPMAVQDIVTALTELTGSIIISCVDSIKARQEIWAAVQRCSYCDWYVEMRMGAEEANIHSVDMRGDIGWYDDYIAGQSDEMIADAPCTSKATIFCAFGAAAFACEIVRKIVTGITPPHKIVVDFFSNTLMVI